MRQLATGIAGEGGWGEVGESTKEPRSASDQKRQKADGTWFQTLSCAILNEFFAAEWTPKGIELRGARADQTRHELLAMPLDYAETVSATHLLLTVHHDYRDIRPRWPDATVGARP